jgi:hypothetical protein
MVATPLASGQPELFALRRQAFTLFCRPLYPATSTWLPSGSRSSCTISVGVLMLAHLLDASACFDPGHRWVRSVTSSPPAPRPPRWSVCY